MGNPTVRPLGRPLRQSVPLDGGRRPAPTAEVTG
ncbi:hypothetical protein SVEN_2989 [Streptomyces venezuelae ATCC 10712]|uniref:Uncharacterized protein n=1 Tax=Streptomyces venezuelae (strain ATCC 10712 / CBS 650.69 / DSM 40230 / JCM 4526 / NBRC 13096 / PD 04745) TaxID=953739 RepID=F2R7J0_STRVP|nr:hypothetical protein SVEN_2989 [Streptomyces venezuelae ATCC 10712]